jgi:predicted Zn-dependent protease
MPMGNHAPTTLAATCFDGSHAAERQVTLRLVGGDLQVCGDGIDRVVAAADLQWPEPDRHGIRVLHFVQGGSVQCSDSAAWDAWCLANGRSPGLVARMQGSWRWVLTSVAVLVLLALALQRWGIPALADATVAAIPASVELAIGASALDTIDRLVMEPSRLPLAEQARLRAAFRRVTEAQPAGTVPPWQLVFRRSRIGPNAFALPGGTLVMTDELVALFKQDDPVILGVLAHELGHVRQRHGLRMLVQGTVLAGVSALVFGDFSTLFAGAPAALGSARYSRDAEREADREAAHFLKAAGISPLVMVRFFEVLADKLKRPPADESDTGSAWNGLSIASHPADAERIRYFQEQARE